MELGNAVDLWVHLGCNLRDNLNVCLPYRDNSDVFNMKENILNSLISMGRNIRFSELNYIWN